MHAILQKTDQVLFLIFVNRSFIPLYCDTDNFRTFLWNLINVGANIKYLQCPLPTLGMLEKESGQINK